MENTVLLIIANVSRILIPKMYLLANIPQCMAKVPNKEQPANTAACMDFFYLPNMKFQLIKSMHSSA